MVTTEAIATVQRKYQSLSPLMDEKMRRRWAASEALALGWGGIAAVAEATGLSHNTIRTGIAEDHSSQADPNDPANDPAVRRPGGGRKRLAQRDRTLLIDLETLAGRHFLNHGVRRGSPWTISVGTCAIVGVTPD